MSLIQIRYLRKDFSGFQHMELILKLTKTIWNNTQDYEKHIITRVILNCYFYYHIIACWKLFYCACWEKLQEKLRKCEIRFEFCNKRSALCHAVSSLFSLSLRTRIIILSPAADIVHEGKRKIIPFATSEWVATFTLLLLQKISYLLLQNYFYCKK